MISILIPTYNFDVYPLVKELSEQLQVLNSDFEIVCIDDGSSSIQNTYNDKINGIPNCVFSVLPKNIGRSKIRNLLVAKAKYDWLLFLDADGFPVANDFMNFYMNLITKDNGDSVFCGGRKHKLDEINLRTKFGLHREEVSIEKRKKEPYKYFFTNNFLIKKEVFNIIMFNEELKAYGYEDLLFGIELKRNNIKVLQVNNPVYHVDIECNEVFLEKTKNSLANLVFLEKKGFLKANRTSLLKFYVLLKKMRLLFLVKNKIAFFSKKAIEKSSLLYFDLFRLSYLYYLKKK